MIENELRRGIIEALGGLNAKPLPSEDERQAAYDAELVRRFNAGEYLTRFDARAARKLIAAQS